MKLETVNGERGYLINPAAYLTIKQIVIGEKTYYFLPVKHRRNNNINFEDVMEKLRAGKSKKEIAEEYNCEVSKINNVLIRNTEKKSANLKIILHVSD